MSRLIKRSLLDGLCLSFLLSLLLLSFSSDANQELLKLNRNVLIFTFGILVGVGASAILNSLGIITLGELLFAPLVNKQNTTYENVDISWYRKFWSWQLVIMLIAVLGVGVFKTKFSFLELLDEDGFNGAMKLFKGLGSPEWSVLPRAVVNIIETIFMAFMATALAIPFAFVLSFFAAKNLMKSRRGQFVYFLVRTILNVVRSIEALIWAIIFSVWVGIGPFSGMLALMIHSIASLTKQYSEMIESVSEGPIEGIQATGASPVQVVWFAIVPQVILPFISFTVYRWDINVRMATIIGMVGGGGIGTMLMQYQGQAMWHEVGCIIVVIAVVVWAMDQSSGYIREALK